MPCTVEAAAGIPARRTCHPCDSTRSPEMTVQRWLADGPAAQTLDHRCVNTD